MEARADYNDAPFPEIGEHSSQLWIKNPHEKTTLPLIVEPWGTQLNLLPGQSYLVVSEFDTPDEVEALTVEPNGHLTVWPQGSKRNRVYRETGKIVWDDKRPSEVYRFLTDVVIEAALEVVRTPTRVNLSLLDMRLREGLPTQHYRDDIAHLLVEHGMLRLEEDGSLNLREAPLSRAIRTRLA